MQSPIASPPYGFSLVELLVSVAIMMLVMAGVGAFYLANKFARTSEDLNQTAEAQLRLGMDQLMFNLRSAGYGVPTTNLSSWIPWVAGLTTDPIITPGATAADPDTITIAACTSKPIGYLNANATVGAIALTVDDAARDSIDVAHNKRLIFVNEAESVYVNSVSGNVLNIDTNPLLAGPQGISRSYPGPMAGVPQSGTPICRVDVITYSVDTANKKLVANYNQGSGSEVIVDGIINMKIVTDATGVRAKYKVTLTAKSSQIDPLTRTYVQRDLTSTASRRH